MFTNKDVYFILFSASSVDGKPTLIIPKILTDNIRIYIPRLKKN